MYWDITDLTVQTDGPKRRILSSESLKQELMFEGSAGNEESFVFVLLHWNKERQIWKVFNQSEKAVWRTRHWQKTTSLPTFPTGPRERTEREAQIGDKAITCSPSLCADEISHQAAAVYRRRAETRRERKEGGVKETSRLCLWFCIGCIDQLECKQSS